MPGLTRTHRIVALVVFALVALLVLVAPVAVLIVAAFAKAWTGPLPTAWTTLHVSNALSGDTLASLSVSLQTALAAGIVAAFVGTWSALASRGLPRHLCTLTATVMHLPAAIPSVVVGLGVLVAFAGPPMMMSGEPTIVIVTQITLVLSFAYSSVSSAATRLDPKLAQAAASLGASSLRVLLKVEIPLLLPAIGAAFELSLALAMGELGATIMVYPPTWRTLPVSVFTASDRGDLFTAAACTLVLVAVTAVILGLVTQITQNRSQASVARRRLFGRRTSHQTIPHTASTS